MFPSYTHDNHVSVFCAVRWRVLELSWLSWYVWHSACYVVSSSYRRRPRCRPALRHLYRRDRPVTLTGISSPLSHITSTIGTIHNCRHLPPNYSPPCLLWVTYYALTQREISLSLLGWLLNKKAARVEVNISLAYLYWVGIAVHLWPLSLI